MARAPEPHAPGRRSRSAQQRRVTTSGDLVAAAVEVIAAEGVAAATTRKIAERADVPLGAVHYWFSDKQALLAEVVASVVARLEEAVAAAADVEATTGRDAVRETLLAAWREVVDDDPGVQLGAYELTTMALRSPGMRDLARAQYRSYRALTTQSVLRVTDLEGSDPRTAVVAQLVASTFDGLTLAWLVEPDAVDAEGVLDLLADLLHAHLDRPLGPRPA